MQPVMFSLKDYHAHYQKQKGAASTPDNDSLQDMTSEEATNTSAAFPPYVAGIMLHLCSQLWDTGGTGRGVLSPLCIGRGECFPHCALEERGGGACLAVCIYLVLYRIAFQQLQKGKYS